MFCQVIDLASGMALGHDARQRSAADKMEVTELNASLVDLAIRPELQRVMCAVRPAVETIVDIEPSIGWTFRTQPGAFRRILTNLYGNALKYTKHGYITLALRAVDDLQPLLEVSKPAPKPRTELKMIITDTGSGISPAFLKTRVFNAFTQENRRSAGCGLGLAVVKSLVTQLDGEIDIKSALNVGTVVSVSRCSSHTPFHYIPD